MERAKMGGLVFVKLEKIEEKDEEKEEEAHSAPPRALLAP
jgi:hypothetical protein